MARSPPRQHRSCTKRDEPRGAGGARTFDLRIPLRQYKGADAYPEDEDRSLTDYLLAAIADTQSQSTTPPSCPWCGSRSTWLSRNVTATSIVEIPGFQCRSCGKSFNRRVGTPLYRSQRMHLFVEFVPFLGWQAPYRIAARRIGMKAVNVRLWVGRFRKWLRQLDPSGEWEARVRLGLKPPEAVARCPDCAHRGDVRFCGFWVQVADAALDRRVRKVQCLHCGHIFPLEPQSTRVSDPHIAESGISYSALREALKAVAPPIGYGKGRSRKLGDDAQRDRIARSYLSGEHSVAELSARWDVGKTTIRRLVQEYQDAQKGIFIPTRARPTSPSA